MPVRKIITFHNIDECIKAACSYANKHKQSAIVSTTEAALPLINNSINCCSFNIAFLNNNTMSMEFKYKPDLYDIMTSKQRYNPLYDLIIDKFKSIENFINNHSHLILFL